MKYARAAALPEVIAVLTTHGWLALRASQLTLGEP
jgi:hypothetical protein